MAEINADLLEAIARRRQKIKEEVEANRRRRQRRSGRDRLEGGPREGKGSHQHGGRKALQSTPSALNHVDRPIIPGHRRRPMRPGFPVSNASKESAPHASHLPSLGSPSSSLTLESIQSENSLKSPPAKQDVSGLRRESFCSAAYLESAPVLLGSLSEGSNSGSDSSSEDGETNTIERAQGKDRAVDDVPPPAPQSTSKHGSARSKQEDQPISSSDPFPPPLPQAAPLPPHSAPFRAVQSAIRRGIVASPQRKAKPDLGSVPSENESGSDGEEPTLPPRSVSLTSHLESHKHRHHVTRGRGGGTGGNPCIPAEISKTEGKNASDTKYEVTERGSYVNVEGDDVRSELKRLREEVAEIRILTSRQEHEGAGETGPSTSRSTYALEKMSAGAQITARELRARSKLLREESHKFGKKVVARVDRAVAGPRGQAMKLAVLDVKQQCIPLWCGGVRNLPSTNLGEAIFKRTIVLTWVHFISGVVLAIVTLSSLGGGLATSGRLGDSRFGVSLLFLLFCKFISLLSVSAMLFRNIDLGACCYCCRPNQSEQLKPRMRKSLRAKNKEKATRSLPLPGPSKWRYSHDSKRASNEEQESMLGHGAQLSTGSSQPDFVRGGGILYEWGWLRCVIYLKILDTVLGFWAMLAMFRAMGLPPSVSASASVAAVLFFSFVAWAVVEVWGNLLLWTLAHICDRWQQECWEERSGTVSVEDGLRLRKDGRAFRESDSEDDDDDNVFKNNDEIYGDMDLGSIATARRFASSDSERSGSLKVPTDGHSMNAMSVPRLNLRGVGTGGGAGGAFVPKIKFAGQKSTVQIPRSGKSLSDAKSANTEAIPPIMQAIASVAGVDLETNMMKQQRASSAASVGEAVQPASGLHPADFEEYWTNLPTTSSVTMELYVLPSPDAIKRFVAARNFRVVASGLRGPTFSAYISAQTSRKSGGTCLFLAELVFDAPQRTLSATFKCEKRKYLQVFLESLSLHQLDSYVNL